MKAMPKPKGRGRPQRTQRAATTSVVLGSGKPAPDQWQERTVARKWKRHYRRLLRLRNDLLAARGDLIQNAAEAIGPFSQHMADAASDAFEHDLALAELSAEQDALYEVEEALRRIERGTYGVCELTGEPIPAARLDAIPWTRFTAAACVRLERRGVMSRPKLGPLRSLQDEDAARLAESPEEETDERDEAQEERLWPVYGSGTTVPPRRDGKQTGNQRTR